MKWLIFILFSLLIIQYRSYNSEINKLRNELSIVDNKLKDYEITLEKMRESDSTCTLLFNAIMESDFENGE